MTLQSEHRRLNLARCIKCGEFHATDKGCNVRSRHIAPVVRSYYKNCAWCGKFTSKDRWIDKVKAKKNNARPLCIECARNSDYPEV